jgi:type I restriction enzyme M protein
VLGQVGFIANLVRLYREEEPEFTFGGDEAAAKLKEIFGKKPEYTDIAGLCKAARLSEVKGQGWSLNPVATWASHRVRKSAMRTSRRSSKP